FVLDIEPGVTGYKSQDLLTEIGTIQGNGFKIIHVKHIGQLFFDDDRIFATCIKNELGWKRILQLNIQDNKILNACKIESDRPFEFIPKGKLPVILTMQDTGIHK